MVDAAANPFVHIVDNGRGLHTTGVVRCSLGHRLASSAHGPDGVFAGWSFDGEKLVVETDRYGIQPLFVWVAGNEVAVSPSISALLTVGAPADIDLDALCVFLHTGFFLGRETPFRAIRAVPPGGRIEWRGDAVDICGAEFLTAPAEIGRDQAIDAYIELFRAAIRRRPPHGRVAVPLSGGRDSRHILFELVAAGHPPDVCITARYFPPRPDDDAAVASQVAAAVDVPHVLLEQSDEFQTEAEKNRVTGLCTDEHAWFAVVAQFLSSGIDTIYDGIGGDVLSAGLFLTPGRIDKQTRGHYGELAEDFLSRRNAKTLRRLLARDLRTPLSPERARDRIAAELAKHAEAANPIGSFCFWSRTRREVALAPYAMGPPHATTYAPYLDHDLYDFLAALPASMLVDRSFHTEAIRRAFPQHAALAFERPGLAPVDARSQDRKFIDALVASARSRSHPSRSLLAPGAMRKLRRARAFDRLRAEHARMQPRLALYLQQLETFADG